MLEDVRLRLEMLGYTPTGSDDKLITYQINKVTSTVKRKLNIVVLPEDDMKEVLVDMVCGDVLAIKRSIGEYAPTNAEQLVKTVQEGDTSVTFDNKTTPDQLINNMIAWLSSGHNGALMTYRRIRW